jgi:hypothetical protein
MAPFRPHPASEGVGSVRVRWLGVGSRGGACNLAVQVTFELRSPHIQGAAQVQALLWVRTMSIYAFTELHEPAGAGAAAGHLRIWLSATASCYDATARESFVRAHPVLFGRASELTLRGYDRWRWRRRLHDTEATFARYMAPRHERWLAAHAHNSAMAPCLIGSGTTLPCWAVSGRESSSAQDEAETAA